MTTLTKFGITSMLSIALLFPNVGVIFADSVSADPSISSNSQAVSIPEIPDHAAKVRDMVDRETTRHPDWVGIFSWNATNAKIDYLGPANQNPYKVDRSQWAHSPPIVNNTKIEQTKIASSTQTASLGPNSVLTIYKPINVFDSIYWRLFGGGNSIYKIQQSFTLGASSTTGVNLYHWLNAHNSNVKKWLQVSAVYDKAHFWNPTSQWYVDYDMWDMTSGTGCAEDSSFPIQTPVSFTTGNTAVSYVRADGTTAGKYWMGVTSGSSGASVSITIPSDSGTTIDIGYTTNCSLAFPSATEIEEESTSSGSVYYYGTPTYTYTFYPTSGGSPTTTVYSYNGKGGYGGSVTESTNPAWVKYSCTGALTCP